MKPGDIYWVELPSANGHEQSGRRPALILQDEEFTSYLPLVIAAPITASASARRFVGTVPLEASTQTGLNKPSVALIFQIRALDKRRIGERIGNVEPSKLAEIHATLDRLLGR